MATIGGCREQGPLAQMWARVVAQAELHHTQSRAGASQVEAARLRATLRSRDGNGKYSYRDSDVELPVSPLGQARMSVASGS